MSKTKIKNISKMQAESTADFFIIRDRIAAPTHVKQQQ
jgi:hypothetical protein